MDGNDPAVLMTDQAKGDSASSLYWEQQAALASMMQQLLINIDEKKESNKGVSETLRYIHAHYALPMNRGLILLDEPTTYLDISYQLVDKSTGKLCCISYQLLLEQICRF